MLEFGYFFRGGCGWVLGESFENINSFFRFDFFVVVNIEYV